MTSEATSGRAYNFLMVEKRSRPMESVKVDVALISAPVEFLEVDFYVYLGKGLYRATNPVPIRLKIIIQGKEVIKF